MEDIKNDDELMKAFEAINKLWDSLPGSAERTELFRIADAISKYERSKLPKYPKGASE